MDSQQNNTLPIIIIAVAFLLILGVTIIIIKTGKINKRVRAIEERSGSTDMDDMQDKMTKLYNYAMNNGASSPQANGDAVPTA